MDKLTVLVVLFAFVLPAYARSPSRPNSYAAVSFSADQPVSDGHPVSKVCGRCCQDGSYCGHLEEDLSWLDNSSPAKNHVFQRGSDLTCVLRARDVFGAVDGGLCVPSSLPIDDLPESFCITLDQVGLLDTCLPTDLAQYRNM